MGYRDGACAWERGGCLGKTFIGGSQASLVLREQERHVELAQYRIEGLRVEQAHPPNGTTSFDRNALEHALGELVTNRSVRHLGEPIADEVLVVGVCELAECLRDLPVVRRALTAQA